jgi:hypothetical protein
LAHLFESIYGVDLEGRFDDKGLLIEHFIGVEQIEDLLGQLSEAGITVREADPPIDGGSRQDEPMAVTDPEQPRDGLLFHRYRADMSVIPSPDDQNP